MPLRAFTLAALPLLLTVMPAPLAAEPTTATIEARIGKLDLDAALKGPKQVIAEGQALLLEAEGKRLSASNRIRLLRYLAAGHHADYNYAESLKFYTQALALIEKAGGTDGPEHDLVSASIAIGLAKTGKADEARVLQEKAVALRLARYGKQSREYSEALYNLGNTSFALGDRPLATRRMIEALAILKALPVKPGDKPDANMANYGMSIAFMHNLTGNIPEGLDAAREAALWAEANLGPDHALTAAALHNFGGVLISAGRVSEAEPILRRTLPMKVAVLGKDHPETGVTMNLLGYALEQLDHMEEAEVLHVAASAIAEAHPDGGAPEQAGLYMMRAANIAFDRGDNELALARRQKVMALLKVRVPEGHFSIPQAQWGLGRSLQRTGQLDKAIAELTKSVAGVAAKYDKSEPVRVRIEMSLAEALVQAGRSKEGMDVALAAYSAARSKLDAAKADGGAVVRTEAAYRVALGQFVQLAFATGRNAEGIEAIQFAQSGDLEKSSRALAARLATDNPESRDLVRKVQDGDEAYRQLRAAEAAALASGDGAAQQRVATEMSANRAQVGALEAGLDAVLPGFRNASRPRPLALAALQAGLAPAEALLLVQPSESGLVTAAITRDTVVTHFAQGAAGRFYNDVHAVRGSIEEAQVDDQARFAYSASASLHAAIFTPEIEAALKGRKELKVVAGGYLGTLPFALLRPAEAKGVKPRWLIERFAISTPLSLEPKAFQRRMAEGGTRLAGIGAPALSAPSGDRRQMLAMLRSGAASATELRQLPSLPGAEAELRAIDAANANPGNVLITGAAATEAAVRAMPLERYGLLVFATHGLVSGELNGISEPSLVLTPPATSMGSENDGLLTASEIARMKLDADWVILSACNTAAGSGKGTPNYSGLARAFVQAGARSLLLSHWRVRDDAAAFLTTQTLKSARKGASRAEALRKAQLGLMHNRAITGSSHPALWAPFILVGN